MGQAGPGNVTSWEYVEKIQYKMDTLTKQERSALMAKIGSKWTGPERKLYEAMKGLGLDPRTHDAQLPGRPDFVFDDPPACDAHTPEQHAPWRPLAVLTEGCHWHACPKHYKLPKTNKKFWHNKITNNVARDARNRRALNRMGIRVMRVWEHDLRTADAAGKAAETVRKRLCARN